MGLDGGQSIGMPKSSSEISSKSDFQIQNLYLRGLNLMVVLTWEREVERGIGIWGETVVWGWRGGSGGWWRGGSGGDGDLDGGNCDVEGHGEDDLGGGDLCLFSQARRVVGESGGGIGIAGEPARCGEGDLGGGDLCLFCQARRVLGESGGKFVLQGNPHVVVCPCFSLDL